MASSIAAITTGSGGIVSTGDSSGNLNLVSGTTTIVAVTSAGVSVTGTLTASGTTTLASPVLSGTVTGTYTLGGTPTLTAPALGTPASGVLTNCTGILATMKIGTFTRDLTTASGTQAITGVGFTPRFVTFASKVTGVTGYGSRGGVDNGTIRTCFTDRWQAANATWAVKSDASVHMQGPDATDGAAYISAFGADGFTLTWTKTGSPTGTGTINYVAFA